MADAHSRQRHPGYTAKPFPAKGRPLGRYPPRPGTKPGSGRAGRAGSLARKAKAVCGAASPERILRAGNRPDAHPAANHGEGPHPGGTEKNEADAGGGTMNDMPFDTVYPSVPESTHLRLEKALEEKEMQNQLH